MVRRSMIAVLLLLVNLAFGDQQKCSEQMANKKVDREVEVVFVLDASQSIIDSDYESMIDNVRKFPDLAQLGEKNVRVGVVVFSMAPKIELELTADEGKIRSLTKTRVQNGTRTHLALEKVRNVVFAAARANAMRVVILITDGMPTVEDGNAPNGYRNDTIPTEKEAARLRSAGVIMFAAYVGNVTPKIRTHLENVTNDPGHVVPVAKFSDLAVVIKEKLTRAIECYYEEVCYFDSVGKCVWEARRPDNAGTCCTNEPPKGGPNCDAEKCTATCNQWQWAQDADCSQKNPGETVKLQRKGPRPTDKRFAYCLEMAEVICRENEISAQPPTGTYPPPTPPPTPPQPTEDPIEFSEPIGTPNPNTILGTCKPNHSSFGAYLGSEMQCLQSESTRLWISKIIIEILYQLKAAEANGKSDEVKRQIEGCFDKPREEEKFLG